MTQPPREFVLYILDAGLRRELVRMDRRDREIWAVFEALATTAPITRFDRLLCGP